MKILFIHPNMPGQYKHLARILAEDKNNEVLFLTKPRKDLEIPNVKKIEYIVNRDSCKEIHRYLIPMERGVLAAQEVWRICKKLKEEGFTPDVICGHLGWGDGLFLKDIYHNTPILAFMEFFYSAYSSDMSFLKDNENPFDADDGPRLRSKNAIHLMNLTNCDWCITPTYFQRNRHPEIFHHKISVLHDGIDTETVKPDDSAFIKLANGIKLTKKDEVITYISRNFEPYRGYPEFMRSVELIQKQRPNAHIIVVGQDGVSYGKDLPDGQTYRQKMMDEVNIDLSRFHYIGFLPYNDMVKIMQISSAHIYLTVPFVLSWSMMEAMAAGCTMIVSNTAPILEVVEHEKSALMVDFFEPQEIADAVDRVFEDESRMAYLGKAARQIILDKYSLEKVLPLHIELIKDLGNGKLIPPAAKKIEKLNPCPDIFNVKKKELV